MLRQTEEDADKEILELKTRYEKALRAEREGNVQLRGESGILKKKFSTAIKDGEEHRANIHRYARSTKSGRLHLLQGVPSARARRLG